jgi:diaminohydroxyphosphoribosylaminopyrimidine deaminase / 5-amino-6-(5-phosphoribosylamino)uracil reductase
MSAGPAHLRPAWADAPGLAPILAVPIGQTFVVAQLGQSLDGRIALPSGESRWINKPAALTHVHCLRAAVDAVIVGVGTVVADDPHLNVRHVAGRNPARVVIDPKGRLPMDGRWADGTDGARRLVIRSAAGATQNGVEEILLPAPGGRFDPSAVVAALASRGLPRLLIEGGAWTVSAFIDAGAVDRLHILVGQMILGSGKTGLNLTGISRLADAPRPSFQAHVLSDGDVLFDCDLRQSRS